MANLIPPRRVHISVNQHAGNKSQTNREFWQTARQNGLRDWLERDLYQDVDELVESFIENVGVDQSKVDATLQRIHQITLGGKLIHLQNFLCIAKAYF